MDTVSYVSAQTQIPYVLASNDIFLRVFGIVVLILSVFFLILQLLFITVNSRKCGLAANLSFTLMVFISALDCVQLVVHIFIGSLFALNLEVPSYIRIIGAVMAAAWITMVTSTILLTIERLIWTIYPFQAKSIFRPCAARAFLLGLCLFFAMFLLVNLTPLSALSFSRDYMSWYYNRTEYPYSFICSILDTASNYAAAIITTSIYAVIFAILSRRRTQIKKNKDVGITLLVFCFCAYQIVCFIIWEFVFPALDRNFYLSCINMIMWIIWNGASALLYILFSVSFRRGLVEMFKSVGRYSEARTFIYISRMLKIPIRRSTQK